MKQRCPDCGSTAKKHDEADCDAAQLDLDDLDDDSGFGDDYDPWD